MYKKLLILLIICLLLLVAMEIYLISKTLTTYDKIKDNNQTSENQSNKLEKGSGYNASNNNDLNLTKNYNWLIKKLENRYDSDEKSYESPIYANPGPNGLLEFSFSGTEWRIEERNLNKKRKLNA